ncbi:MAG: hypothetical protein ACJ8CB_23740 [Ktedonobacteraceae bacterium]
MADQEIPLTVSEQEGEQGESGMESEHVRQEVYQIVVKGHLDSEWSDWFDGLTITMVDNGETVLSGPIVDQTALHGVLIKIRDLGLPLLSLTHTEPGRGNESNLLIHPEEGGRAG